MKVYMFVMLGVLLAGCCCVSSDIGDLGESNFTAGLSCNTYAQSCDKSCSAIAPDEYSSCVQECEDVLREDGVDPSSCCTEEFTVGGACELSCGYDPEEDYQACINSCEQSMEGTGLDLDDCIVPT